MLSGICPQNLPADCKEFKATAIFLFSKMQIDSSLRRSAEKFPWAKKNFSFLDLFEGIVVSGEEKVIKPNPEIYKRLLTRYNLKAEDCVFIDDNAANVEAARALGMAGIRFTSPARLKEELSALDNRPLQK